METLAFLHASMSYEDPQPEDSLQHLDESQLAIANPLVAGMTGSAVVLSMMAIAPGTSAVIQRGYACPAVRQVQSALQQKGFNPGSVDGVFGPTTEAATIEFQRHHHLPADGKIEGKTAEALGLSCAEAANRALEVNANYLNSSGGGGGSITTVRIRTNGNPLNVRSGPATTYPVVGVVSNGIAVRVSDSSNGWLRLAERDGWIAAQWTSGSASGGSTGSTGSSSTGGSTGSSTGSTSSGSVRIATHGSPLNVRSGPGTNHGIIGVLSNGAVVNTTGRTSDGWVELARGEWVAAQWTNLGGVSHGSGGTSSARRAIVSTNGRPLNIRDRPNGSVIGAIANRSSLRLSGRRSGGWAEILSGSSQAGGWVSEQWIRYQ
ncbi:MAG TPA: SH3 domain-containing protein [Crinalium sp.]|jgi:peptidoglycan hydrolase-like protein with peptidoglycan-binding domain